MAGGEKANTILHRYLEIEAFETAPPVLPPPSVVATRVVTPTATASSLATPSPMSPAGGAGGGDAGREGRDNNAGTVGPPGSVPTQRLAGGLPADKTAACNGGKIDCICPKTKVPKPAWNTGTGILPILSAGFAAGCAVSTIYFMLRRRSR
jgi:hypothetical protein